MRTTFKALHDVVKAQGQTIRRLEQKMQEKANWSEVESSLAARATVADVNNSLQQLQTFLMRK